jgi:hypothetical protein
MDSLCRNSVILSASRQHMCSEPGSHAPVTMAVASVESLAHGETLQGKSLYQCPICQRVLSEVQWGSLVVYRTCANVTTDRECQDDMVQAPCRIRDASRTLSRTTQLRSAFTRPL